MFRKRLRRCPPTPTTFSRAVTSTAGHAAGQERRFIIDKARAAKEAEARLAAFVAAEELKTSTGRDAESRRIIAETKRVKVRSAADQPPA